MNNWRIAVAHRRCATANELQMTKPIESRPSLKRVLSGMRPTGKLHLGNYMGALYNWVRLQDEYECYFFIADWHALTTDYADTSNVKQNILDVALDWLARGARSGSRDAVRPSHVPQHAELHLLFSHDYAAWLAGARAQLQGAAATNA